MSAIPSVPRAFEMFQQPAPFTLSVLGDDISMLPEPHPDDVGPTRVYIAGPMSGYPNWNFDAFREAAATLREMGFSVLSPVEMDEADGTVDANEHDEALQPADYAAVLARDIARIVDERIEAIVVLPGWEASGGANTEVAFGRAQGLPILRYPDLDEITNLQQVSATAEAQRKDGEVRIVDKSTGGEKGQKIARFDLIPPNVERQDALVYGAGAKKYADDNWRLGYSWRLSYGAMRRHINAWARGESWDEELSDLAGEPVHHLAAARWHCAVLMTFEEYGLGTEDIPERLVD